jgi:di/tricarboxylate transporter
MALELIQPAIVVLVASVALLLLGVTTPEQAFSGFSNEAPIIVASLLVLARAVEISGLLQPVVSAIFGTVSGTRQLLARLSFPIAAASAFLNNTTLVAMTVPTVIELSRRRGMPVSRFLIPVSYAAVLGGVITTVGTSTNLTVSGLLSRHNMPPLTLFEITPVGLPAALLGVVVMVLLAPRLLPERSRRSVPVAEHGRDFTVSMRVVEGGPLDGTTVESAGLRHLHGVFLVEIERDGSVIAPVGPNEILRSGDNLAFVGRVDDVIDLQGIRGLVSTERRQLERLGGRGHSFYEVVVSESELTGQTLREIGFRARYNAAVLAIHRQGQQLDAKLGEVALRLGDTLLVLADSGFRERWRDTRDFLVIAPLAGASPIRTRKAPIVAAIGLGFVVLTGLGILPILQAALLVPLLLIATGSLSVAEARGAISLDLIVLIAASFGLGAAVEVSGLAQVSASTMLAFVAPFGVLAALAAIYVATVILTEVISHNAAAVLLFPIAAAAASQLGLDPRPFIIAVLFGASLSFLSPIGYQTHLMVYGLGGYRFLDFTRVGAPVTLVAGVTVVLLIPIFFPFRPV